MNDDVSPGVRIEPTVSGFMAGANPVAKRTQARFLADHSLKKYKLMPATTMLGDGSPDNPLFKNNFCFGHFNAWHGVRSFAIWRRDDVTL
ncbi:MAG: hypothetical protein V6Z86_06170 [Hyphomicrobiales bacterium]